MQAMVIPENRVIISPKPIKYLKPNIPPTIIPIPEPISPRVTNHQTIEGSPYGFSSVTGSFENPCCRNKILTGTRSKNCAMRAET